MKRMLTKTWKIAPVLVLAVSLAACGSAKNGESGGASYPDKALTIVAPSGAGGGWDMTARTIVKVLTETKATDKPITVENKPGGGGAVFMAEYATKDAKDNYKLFVNSPPILINHLKKEGNSPYGYGDTTPLAQLTKDYGAIAVSADSKYNDLKTLLDDLKADPTAFTVAGGSAPGSMDHLVSILPAFKYGIDPKSVKYVSYDGGGEAITALLGGNADVLGTDASSLDQYVKAGKIKVLAVESPERLGGSLAEVPTLKELGIDAEFLIWRGIFGPKEMSADAKAFWDGALTTMTESEAWKSELTANNWQSDYKDSEAFKTFLAEQEGQLKEMLTALGMQK
ncbi:putative tricarboxylic transport membrane protein [Paenibacillus methanolicus]|uniref:Putative tricarboxylic transport membrane protein n=2 Tax=Paenibacillus methanolicus TaxID=582686 RepID=A0A5S5CIC6_9BACL|nr:tripartite tricarboxylate transporter substrate-binding protein [Paenibacillus methanolicus]TYP79472.1 putative tricarboxylic transport membrane protein [Paenibacillus methanolicus]